MVRIVFIVDGHKVDAEDTEVGFPRPLERAMAGAMISHVRRRMGTLRCPQHREFPRVTGSGPSLEQLAFSVEGCCQRLIDDAAAALDVSPQGGGISDAAARGRGAWRAG